MPVVLITGASSGIGQVTAQQLAAQGYRVIGTSRRATGTVEQGVTMIPLDVTDPASIAACIAQATAIYGRIDVLINNAGLIGVAGALEEVSLAEARATFETNYWGVVAMIQAILPQMRAQRSGRIINISSLAGVVAAPQFFGHYIASKHALEGFSKTLRHELAPFNIHVSLVEPGYVISNINATLLAPAAPIDAYAAIRERVTALDHVALHYGDDPVLVAATVGRILRLKRPAVRYLVGSNTAMLGLGLRLMPNAWVEAFFNWLYVDPRWHIPLEAIRADNVQALGLRRFFLLNRPPR